MTLFRPAVIESQRRRVYGSVTLHQPARLAAFTILAVVSVALLFVYLVTARMERKETVVGWLVPTGGLSEVRAMSGGVIAAVGVSAGSFVTKGEAIVWMDMSSVGGSTWNRERLMTGMVLTAPTTGTIVSINARVGEVANPQMPLVTIAPAGSPLEARLLLPTRAAAMVEAGQDVRLMLDAYPFQRFGAVQGIVSGIGRAAVKPSEINAPVEFREAVYPMNIAIPAPYVVAYGVKRPLEIGMTLKADIVTDKRTFMTWLLDPLLAARARAFAG